MQMWNSKLWEAFCVVFCVLLGITTIGLFINDDENKPEQENLRLYNTLILFVFAIRSM